MERERIALDMWEGLGRTFGEFFHLDSLARQGSVRVEDEDRLKEMAASAPFVVCGLHMGNWEAMPIVCEGTDIKLAGVYRGTENPLIDAWVYARRSRLYPGGLFGKFDDAGRKMLKAARNGASTAFLADQRHKEGIPCRFFGREARTLDFPARMARSLGMPLYAVRILREDGPRFRLRIEKVPIANTGDRERDIGETTASVQSRLEEFIREAPEQWMWGHKRWT